MTLSPSSRPRLRRTIALVPMGTGEWYVHGPAGPSRLVGPAAQTLGTLLPLLDGQHTLAEVVQQGGTNPDAVERTLRALEAAGFLEDALTAQAPASPLEAFLGQAGPSPRSALERLAHARLGILGTGTLVAAIAEQALALGFRDFLLPKPSSEEFTGRLRAAGARVEAESAFTLDEEGVAALFTRKPDFVLIATEGERTRLLRAANASALEARIPWMPALVRGRHAEAGPTVLPHESACWRCYDLRRKGANPWLDRHLAYEEMREAGLVPTEAEWGHLPTSVSLLAALAAQEAAAVVAGAWPPALRNHVAIVDALQATSRRHRILKLPRCPACGASDVPDIDSFDLGATGA